MYKKINNFFLKKPTNYQEAALEEKQANNSTNYHVLSPCISTIPTL